MRKTIAIFAILMLVWAWMGVVSAADETTLTAIVKGKKLATATSPAMVTASEEVPVWSGVTDIKTLEIDEAWIEADAKETGGEGADVLIWQKDRYIWGKVLVTFPDPDGECFLKFKDSGVYENGFTPYYILYRRFSINETFNLEHKQERFRMMGTGWTTWGEIASFEAIGFFTVLDGHRVNDVVVRKGRIVTGLPVDVWSVTGEWFQSESHFKMTLGRMP